jgi:hypothetical protein
MNYLIQGQELYFMTRFEKVVLTLMLLQVALQVLSLFSR